MDFSKTAWIVPTWFELAQAETPVDYHMDGESLVPMFKDPSVSIRQHIYAEQGPPERSRQLIGNMLSLHRRLVSQLLKETEQIETKTLLGLSGGNFQSQGFQLGRFSADQLYHLSYDMDSQRTLAEDEYVPGNLKDSWRSPKQLRTWASSLW